MLKGLPKGHQLRYLKRQGIVGISRVATRAVVLASVLIAYLAVLPRVLAEIERLFKQSSLASSMTVVQVLVLVVMVSSLATFIAAVGSTTLQSRGAFGWKVLRRTRRQPKGLAVIGAYMATLAIMLVTAAAVVILRVGDFLSSVRKSSVPEALVVYGSSLSSAAKLVVVGAGVCAILAATLTRFFFLVKNRIRPERGAQ